MILISFSTYLVIKRLTKQLIEINPSEIDRVIFPTGNEAYTV